MRVLDVQPLPQGGDAHVHTARRAAPVVRMIKNLDIIFIDTERKMDQGKINLTGAAVTMTMSE